MRWMGLYAALGWFSSGCSDAMLERWDWLATDVFGVILSLAITAAYWREYAG